MSKLSFRQTRILAKAFFRQQVVSAKNADDRDACQYLLDCGYLKEIFDDVVDITESGKAELSASMRTGFFDILSIIATILSIISIIMHLT